MLSLQCWISKTRPLLHPSPRVHLNGTCQIFNTLMDSAESTTRIIVSGHILPAGWLHLSSLPSWQQAPWAPQRSCLETEDPAARVLQLIFCGTKTNFDPFCPLAHVTHNHPKQYNWHTKTLQKCCWHPCSTREDESRPSTQPSPPRSDSHCHKGSVKAGPATKSTSSWARFRKLMKLVEWS